MLYKWTKNVIDYTHQHHLKKLIENNNKKKLDDVNSFNNSNDNIEEIIDYFKNKNHKSENRFKKIKR